MTMLARDMILLHEAHVSLTNLQGKLSRLAAFRVAQNLTKLDAALVLHQEAFHKTVDSERAGGETEVDAKEIWQELGQEEVAVLGLRNLPADGIPWEVLDPKAAFNLNRLGCVDGDLDAQAIAS